MTIFFVFLLFFLHKVQPVCIETQCPYQCCVDNDNCNTRPDCLLEDSQYCMWSSDCLNGCCHGKLCHPAQVCDDYQIITGVVLGIFYLFLFCCTMSYCYGLVRRRRIRQNLVSNRKVNNIYEGYLVKNLAKMVQSPKFLKNDVVVEKNQQENTKKIMIMSSEEKWNLNGAEEERPNRVLNESPIKKMITGNRDEP